ncbi:hypothetical protein E3E38_00775 [Thermococcus sp. 18S1]|nr:hypothetical protein [Thermococcus sp. 18S1]NJE29588.1 hypothetical protein [Thermococcus sp. 18S1]
MIGVLVAISVISSYSWYKTEDDLKILRTVHEESWSKAYLTATQDIYELSYMGEVFEGLLEENASEDTIVEYAGGYYLRARHVRQIFLFLSYELTEGHSKYYKIGEGFGHLEEFFIDVRSEVGVDKTETIRENIGILKEISRIVKELGEYADPRDIPQELADELLNATSDLKLIYE